MTHQFSAQWPRERGQRLDQLRRGHVGDGPEVDGIILAVAGVDHELNYATLEEQRSHLFVGMCVNMCVDMCIDISSTPKRAT